MRLSIFLVCAIFGVAAAELKPTQQVAHCVTGEGAEPSASKRQLQEDETTSAGASDETTEPQSGDDTTEAETTEEETTEMGGPCCPASDCSPTMESESDIEKCLAAIPAECKLKIQSTYDIKNEDDAFCFEGDHFQLKNPLVGEDVEVKSIEIEEIIGENCNEADMHGEVKSDFTIVPDQCEIPTDLATETPSGVTVTGQDISIDPELLKAANEGLVVSFKPSGPEEERRMQDAACELSKPKHVIIQTETMKPGTLDGGAETTSSAASLLALSAGSILIAGFI